MRQRIYSMQLRRSNRISRILGWAPPHVKDQITTMTPEDFIDACYAWRDQQTAEDKQASDAERAAVAEALGRDLYRDRPASRSQP
jgi:hypothetical protein